MGIGTRSPSRRLARWSDARTERQRQPRPEAGINSLSLSLFLQRGLARAPSPRLNNDKASRPQERMSAAAAAAGAVVVMTYTWMLPLLVLYPHTASSSEEEEGLRPSSQIIFPLLKNTVRQETRFEPSLIWALRMRRRWPSPRPPRPSKPWPAGWLAAPGSFFSHSLAFAHSPRFLAGIFPPLPARQRARPRSDGLRGQNTHLQSSARRSLVQEGTKA